MADKVNSQISTLSKIPGKIFFQYQKSLNLPIFISFDESVFGATLASFLLAKKWSRINENDAKTIDIMLQEKGAKMLYFEECSPAVAKIVRSPISSDQQQSGGSNESISLKEGIRIYRYHNEATFIYSSSHHEAKLGCFLDYGSKIEIANHVINRFLSLALSSFGIVGFWGVPVEDGVVVMRPRDCRSEAVFVDFFKKNIISDEGVSRLTGQTRFFRLDPLLKGKNIKMGQEELISFLNHHCVYFDVQGLSISVRQIILQMANSIEGIWHPTDSFRPRLNNGHGP